MISNISLKNYRNLSGEFNDLKSTNVIVAPNGSGKTNLLESIYFIANGGSFHAVDSTEDLVNYNEQYAKVEIDTFRARISMTISQTKSNGYKRIYQVNGKNSRQKSVSKYLPLILFAPHSVDLVGGDPSGRRTDLDNYLRQLFPDYQESYKRYYKILRNRNAFLKIIQNKPHKQFELQFWTDSLIATAGDIIRARLKFISEIAEYIGAAAKQIYHYKETDLAIEYYSKHGTKPEEYINHLTEKFSTKQNLEIEVGQTLYGPHKDDWGLVFNGRPLRYEGSRGQQRIAVLIYKYAQLLYLKRLGGFEQDNRILFLIDDISSELDAEHRNLVSKFLYNNDNFQSIITATDEDQLGDSLQTANRLELTD